MASNQGRDINALLDIVSVEHLQDVAQEALWPEVRSHSRGAFGETASCFCPAVEALCRLMELGYTITPPVTPQET